MKLQKNQAKKSRSKTMKNEKLELGNGVKRGNRVFGSKNSGASVM